ncbi:CoxG family protein [Salinirubellus salinus]
MRHRDDDPPPAEAADSAPAAVPSEDREDGIMSFADTVRLDTDRHQLWAAITDPETLATCIPGAESVERVSDREYTCEITRSVGRVAVSLRGEAQLVEVHPPDYVVTRGSAFDSKTGSDLEVLAAMELQEADDGRVALSYSAEV